MDVVRQFIHRSHERLVLSEVRGQAHRIVILCAETGTYAGGNRAI